MALRLTRPVFLEVAVIVGGCDLGGIAGQGAPSTAGAGVSQTGTLTVRMRVQQFHTDQAALAGGIARQQGQLNATRSQIIGQSAAYSTLVTR